MYVFIFLSNINKQKCLGSHKSKGSILYDAFFRLLEDQVTRPIKKQYKNHIQRLTVVSTLYSEFFFLPNKLVTKLK